jgi:RHS repeat-associated protein
VLWYVHVDHLNRPVKMTNTAKAAVWDAVFLPWGGVHAITGSATLDARFPGQWFQLESGLHYNWHRQDDPTIGRYIQADPLGFVDGPSVYGYVRGMPQKYVDLTGQSVPPDNPPKPKGPGVPGMPPGDSTRKIQCREICERNAELECQVIVGPGWIGRILFGARRRCIADQYTYCVSRCYPEACN